MPTTDIQDTSPDFDDDILRGADEIAEFIFGDKTHRRKILYLVKCTKLPVFRLDGVLCARRSVLLSYRGAKKPRRGG
jgi:hypothetical protein